MPKAKYVGSVLSVTAETKNGAIPVKYGEVVDLPQEYFDRIPDNSPNWEKIIKEPKKTGGKK